MGLKSLDGPTYSSPYTGRGNQKRVFSPAPRFHFPEEPRPSFLHPASGSVVPGLSLTRRICPYLRFLLRPYQSITFHYITIGRRFNNPSSSLCRGWSPTNFHLRSNSPSGLCRSSIFDFTWIVGFLSWIGISHVICV